MDQSINQFDSYPSHIAIIGGGRWARVLIEAVSKIVPKNTKLSIFTPNNKISMKEWVLEKKLKQSATIYDNFKNFGGHNIQACIVANAARDHEFAISKCLNSYIPVLVEKPLTLSYSASLKMVKLARKNKTFIASAHIFLFNSYLTKFSHLLSCSGKLKSIEIDWSDPIQENRYGERKKFDPSLPIFFDLLPHIVSIIFVLTGKCLLKFINLKFDSGGSAIEIEYRVADAKCTVRLARNSDIRRRIIRATADNYLELDFSGESGIIKKDSSVIIEDDHWDNDSRPSAKMLSAFLNQSVGKGSDSRLDVQIGLEANKLIEEILFSYNKAMVTWLKNNLTSQSLIIDNLIYALREILLVNRYSSDEAESLIGQIQRILANGSSSDWIDKLEEDIDPLKLIRKISLN
jgi:predicted dehydrogenase